MKNLVYDLETDNLLDDLTVLHCLVIRDLDSDNVISCTDASPEYPSIKSGLEILSRAERCYAHNGYGFDGPALEKLYPEFQFQGKHLDTLPLVRARWAHQKELDFELNRKKRMPGNLIGSHSLEAWGWRMGILKDDYKDWCSRNNIEEPFAQWRPEMQDYCEQDTLVTKQLVLGIRTAGALPPDVIDLELFMGRYLEQQRRNGWPFDFEKAVRLQAKLASRREELRGELAEHFGSWYEPAKRSKDFWNKIDTQEKVAQVLAHPDYKDSFFVPKRSNSRYGYVAGMPCVKLAKKEFNPASRQHIYGRLMEVYGWKPQEYTPSGQPKVSEATLSGLAQIPCTEELVEYLTLDKRLGQLAEGNQAWLSKMEDDAIQGGRITGMLHIHHSSSAVTITHRPKHSHPNLGQVPSGKEYRELFTVPRGWKLLGADVSGLEMRCLAHYLAKWDDGEYAKAVLEGSKEEGTDVHSKTAKIIGLERPDGKTFGYAYLYGAGDLKLGSIVEPHASETRRRQIGADLRSSFERGFPALGALQEALKQKAKRYGYINLLDGRRVYVRSLHSVLNTLLQGTGAVICKCWIKFAAERLEEEAGPQGWDGQWSALGWIHDEVQIAVRGEAIELAPAIWKRAMIATGEYLGFRLPLAADTQLGDNWSETH